MRNKNYAFALEWTKQNYPFLFVSQISKIELLPARECCNWLGLHIRHSEGDGDGISEIKIRNGQYSVSEFVCTIVHELVHACQYYVNNPCYVDTANSEQKEQNAEDLSTEAVLLYKKQNNIPIWKS